MIIAFFSLVGIIAIIDFYRHIIPNWIVIPGIIMGIIATGYWHYALIMFLTGALFFYRSRMCGGDVKLFTMAGAFLGFLSIPVFVLTLVQIRLYRIIKQIQIPLPITPFMLMCSILTICCSAILKRF